MLAAGPPALYTLLTDKQFREPPVLPDDLLRMPHRAMSRGYDAL